MITWWWVPTAWALTCDEVVDMVEVGVPDDIVIDTIVNSGTAEDGEAAFDWFAGCVGRRYGQRGPDTDTDERAALTKSTPAPAAPRPPDSPPVLDEPVRVCGCGHAANTTAAARITSAAMIWWVMVASCARRTRQNR